MTTTEFDIDRVEADLRERIDTLEQDRARLCLGAFTDPATREELETVESELAHARDELSRIDLARAEQARRDAEARARAEREAQDAAMLQVKELQAERETLARRIDKAAGSLAKSIAEHVGVSARQAALLRQAGEHEKATTADWEAGRYETAFRYALEQACAPLDAVNFAIPGNRPFRSFVEIDPRVA